MIREADQNRYFDAVLTVLDLFPVSTSYLTRIIVLEFKVTLLDGAVSQKLKVPFQSSPISLTHKIFWMGSRT